MTNKLSARRASVLMVMVSAIGFSFNGLIVRLIDTATPFQAVFYRSLGMSLGLFFVYACIYRRDAIRHVTSIGWVGFLGAGLLGASAVGMVFAMYNATVANVVFVSSAIPFFTAGLAWLFLREKVPMTTLAFMAVAFGGVTVMVSGAISLGAGFGNVMALGSALLYGLFVVVIRGRQGTNMSAMVAVAGVWICVTVSIVVGGELSISLYDFWLCMFWGVVIAAVGHSLFVLAARNLAGAEVTFLMLLEFVLAPIWVWLIVDEVPAWSTLWGGALVMGALAAWTLFNARTRNTSARR